MSNRVYLFDELMREDVSLLGRYAFLEKYGLDKEYIYDKITGQYIREITKKSLKDIKEWKLNQMKRITVKEWRAMGKVKAWLMDMEEDATVLSRSEWLDRHGSNHESIFNRIQKEREEIGQGELNLWRDSSDV